MGVQFHSSSIRGSSWWLTKVIKIEFSKNISENNFAVWDPNVSATSVPLNRGTLLCLVAENTVNYSPKVARASCVGCGRLPHFISIHKCTRFKNLLVTITSLSKFGPRQRFILLLNERNNSTDVWRKQR